MQHSRQREQGERKRGSSTALKETHHRIESDRQRRRRGEFNLNASAELAGGRGAGGRRE